MTPANIHTLIWACFIIALVALLVLGSVLNTWSRAKYGTRCSCPSGDEAESEEDDDQLA